MIYNTLTLKEVEDITAEQIRAYASQKGWQPMPSQRPGVLIMRHPTRQPSEILLPLSLDFVDYREALVRAISRLASYLGLSASTVFREIVEQTDQSVLATAGAEKTPISPVAKV